ncbi:hypothetical protein [Nonomuraea basaltis]|uniref:hypothetical protein n=1 Tax=Nonomuraea basaltis TaxID=2495887 RepID=UPI00110C5070|nr:hypothetical protein [Nonomuraea basaltis]TMS00206.1 hypothetical protein EJK15_03785 [Nonomuraea basaltis]
MADLPDDLIQLRRDFLAAQGRLAAAGRVLPSHAAVVAGEAEPATPEQHQAWQTAQAECRRLAVAIQEHSHWEETPDRKAARTALDAIQT